MLTHTIQVNGESKIVTMSSEDLMHIIKNTSENPDRGPIIADLKIQTLLWGMIKNITSNVDLKYVDSFTWKIHGETGITTRWENGIHTIILGLSNKNIVFEVIFNDNQYDYADPNVFQKLKDIIEIHCK